MKDGRCCIQEMIRNMTKLNKDMEATEIKPHLNKMTRVMVMANPHPLSQRMQKSSALSFSGHELAPASSLLPHPPTHNSLSLFNFVIFSTVMYTI
jgi:hypothetical protein